MYGFHKNTTIASVSVAKDSLPPQLSPSSPPLQPFHRRRIPHKASAPSKAAHATRPSATMPKTVRCGVGRRASGTFLTTTKDSDGLACFSPNCRCALCSARFPPLRLSALCFSRHACVDERLLVKERTKGKADETLFFSSFLLLLSPSPSPPPSELPLLQEAHQGHQLSLLLRARRLSHRPGARHQGQQDQLEGPSLLRPAGRPAHCVCVALGFVKGHRHAAARSCHRDGCLACARCTRSWIASSSYRQSPPPRQPLRPS